MSKRKEVSGDGVSLAAVRPLWLNIHEATPNDNYLLLEDLETGDVLMPLIHMKAIFEANYSRKLSSLKNRMVMLPDEEAGADDEPTGSATGSRLRYWRWAFESPHEVKVLVRKTLGEDNAPTGHLRLVLLPIVYNALSQKAEFRETTLFKSLHQVLKHSKYFSLVKRPTEDEEARIEAELGPRDQLFTGPADLKRTMEKYMKTYEEASGDAPLPPSSGKKLKIEGSPIIGSASDDEAAAAGPSNAAVEKLWEALQLLTTASSPSWRPRQHQNMQQEMRVQLAAISRDVGQLSEAVALLSQHIITLTTAHQQTGLFSSSHHIPQQQQGPPPGSSLLPPSLSWLSGVDGSPLQPPPAMHQSMLSALQQQPMSSAAPALSASATEQMSHPLSLRGLLPASP